MNQTLKATLCITGLVICSFVTVAGALMPFMNEAMMTEFFSLSPQALDLGSQKNLAIAVGHSEYTSLFSKKLWIPMVSIGLVGIWFFVNALILIRQKLSVRTLFSFEYWTNFQDGSFVYRKQ